MGKMIHSMIRVLDEGRSLSFYGTAFGAEIAERIDLDGFSLIYLKAGEGEFELELTVNHGRSEPYVIGDGYGHLAVAVDDLEAEHRRLSAAGLRPGDVKTLTRDGVTLARFFFLADPDGYKIEILQRAGRYR